MTTSTRDSFEEVKNSINEALEEIKKLHPDLYNHLKKTIIMNSDNYTFKYMPSRDDLNEWKRNDSPH